MDYGAGWLSYNTIKQAHGRELLTDIHVCLSNNEEKPGKIIDNGVEELSNALKGMLDINILKPNIIREKKDIDKIEAGVVLGLTSQEYIHGISVADRLEEEGYHIRQKKNRIYIIGKIESGILYGIFELIRRISSSKNIRGLEITENPTNNLRMLNHWDNLDGSIERGYSGKSFFFRDDEILVNERTVDYARLIASVGINATVINNVNVRGEAATGLITERYLNKLKGMSEIFDGYGIKLYVSANFAAPIEIGELSTADPLNQSVSKWWENCVKKVYEVIPNFGGFLIKADSEGRPGPFTYNRTHAEGANVLARALKPHGGVLIWRCFVYDCKQDWRDYKTDRARSAYDNFIDLDGEFDNNVILQIKNGPMDFQVREPVSPLFGGLRKTNMALEVQAAQEYTGQQKDVCYLVPMWKEVLDFDTYAQKDNSTIADIVSGKAYNQTLCGMVAVSNTGDDYNWTGHDLAAVNWYGFGRLSWNPSLTSEEIAEEWLSLTFPYNKKVYKVIKDILMGSWHTYEKYTSPLGIGWMVNPNHHYGPNVDGYEYDAWGTYHRADRDGIGVDRTTKGTGYTAQYNEPNFSMYENIETCPEELLLFFHYIKYDYKLKSGKTLIQHIYDTHFEGVEEVEDMVKAWSDLEGLVPEGVYKRVEERFQMQLENSKEWRDRINTYFYRKAGIDDNKKRKIYY